MMAYECKIGDQGDLFPNFSRVVHSIILQMNSSLGPNNFFETAAYPIHHNAAMLVETLHVRSLGVDQDCFGSRVRVRSYSSRPGVCWSYDLRLQHVSVRQLGHHGWPLLH
jgi:hypothetical protein